MGPRALLIVTSLICSAIYSESSDLIGTEDHFKEISRNGHRLYAAESLLNKLNHESEVWHWMPYLRTRTIIQDDVLREVECVAGNSIESFPDTIFTDEQLRMGGFLVFLLFGIYSFTLLAYVCNDYFIPSVEKICESLKIPQNVAAATFMSVATSCPEFFVNTISTFLTESDMGIGTIVGSALFNCLGVAAIGGLAAIKPIAIEARPVTRDVLIYMVNVSVLVVIVWDGQVTWYEAMVLAILYVLYFILMFNSTRLFKLFDKIIAKCFTSKTFDINGHEPPPNISTVIYCMRHASGILSQLSSDRQSTLLVDGLRFVCRSVVSIRKIMLNVLDGDQGDMEKVDKADNNENGTANDCKEESQDSGNSLWRFPFEESWAQRLWWLYSWPLRLVLSATIPSPVTRANLYPLTFFMCIIWIGVNSYFVSWSMTVIGHTFLIPDSIMGMTFLAFGGCIPEACSIYIMSRRGEGGIGVSNALGANSLAILFALGVPWLIRTLTLVSSGADSPVVLINSAGIDFIVASLLVAVACLWLTLFIGKFTLRKTIGAVFLCFYLIFVTFAILVEMGIILDRGLASC